MKNNLIKDIGLAFFRIAISALMLGHGFHKVQKLISNSSEFLDPINLGATPTLFLAAIAEFICPILIIIGFKTRVAAIPPALTMAVAAFIVHGSDSFATKEKALLYLVGFTTIALVGPGKFGIDKR